MTYDRRGNSRSPLRHGRVKTTIAEQSADAIAVLRASGFESARFFGSSGGAIIALDLAAHHPRAVRAVVVHEPPLPAVLADCGEYPAHYDRKSRIHGLGLPARRHAPARPAGDRPARPVPGHWRPAGPGYSVVGVAERPPGPDRSGLMTIEVR